MTYRAVLHLGSNIGDRQGNLDHACDLITAYELEIVAVSSIYETEAWGVVDQAAFVNVAMVIRTPLHPFALLDATQSVELAIGRDKTLHWGPRRIDIDIISYEDLIISTPRLQLPHKQYHKRNFVIYPLIEVDPEGIHPIFNLTNQELLHLCPDDSKVTRL